MFEFRNLKEKRVRERGEIRCGVIDDKDDDKEIKKVMQEEIQQNLR